MSKRVRLVLALMLPIVVLAVTVVMKEKLRANGERVVLSISGFDPVDVLSGHYLTYRVDYGADSVCETRATVAMMCLKPQPVLYFPDTVPAPECQQFILGECNELNQFVAGIERFYIPEQYASILDAKVRDSQGQLVLSVNEQGKAVVADLLIQGRSWRAAVGAH